MLRHDLRSPQMIGLFLIQGITHAKKKSIFREQALARALPHQQQKNAQPNEPGHAIVRLKKTEQSDGILCKFPGMALVFH